MRWPSVRTYRMITGVLERLQLEGPPIAKSPAWRLLFPTEQSVSWPLVAWLLRSNTSSPPVPTRLPRVIAAPERQ